MTNLTEQWKQKKLPRRKDYYVRYNCYDRIMCSYLTKYNDFCDEGVVEEVLAEVPSYEEYQKLLSDQLAKNEGVEINAELEAENTKLKKWCEEFNALDVAKENTKLKELLKECADEFESYLDSGAEGMAKAIREVLKDE